MSPDGVALSRADSSALRGYVRRVRAAARLTPAWWTELAAAQLAIAFASMRVWARGDAIVHAMPEATPASHIAEAIDRDVIERVLWAVDRAARFGVLRPRCLVRSMALRQRLASHGVRDAVVRVGVRRDGATFEAHAWVEWRGLVLGDTPEHVRRFAPLARVEVGDA